MKFMTSLITSQVFVMSFTLWPPYSYTPVSVLHTRRQRMVEWLKPHCPLSSALCIRSSYQLSAWWA